MIYKELLESQSADFEAQIGDIPAEIQEQSYIDFLLTYNGGYYFNNSLHLYGLGAVNDWSDLMKMNELINDLYGDIVDVRYFFGEDIFGNLFAQTRDGCIILNIESAAIEQLGNNFHEWVSILLDDSDYLSGRSLTDEMQNNEIEDLSNGFRLCPRYPFVIGGEYTMKNLYLKYYKNNLEYNSAIAHQVINLSDGQEIKLNINRSK